MVTKGGGLEREPTDAGYAKLNGTGAKQGKFRREDVSAPVPRRREKRRRSREGVRKKAGQLRLCLPLHRR